MKQYKTLFNLTLPGRGKSIMASSEKKTNEDRDILGKNEFETSSEYLQASCSTSTF